MAQLMAIDIETYSDISLPDCGVHRYVASEQFEILLFAYSIDEGEIRVIDLASGEKMPEEVMDLLMDDSVIKLHSTLPLNERVSTDISEYPCRRKYGDVQRYSRLYWHFRFRWKVWEKHCPLIKRRCRKVRN